MLRRLRSIVGVLLRRRRFEDAMADEMRFHVEAYTADLIRAGVPPAEAARRARIEFGAVESVKEDCRQSRGLRLVDELRQDLRYACRQMAKSAGFATAAVVSLALGIGANTAIFSLMDALLFRTLPVTEPDRLFYLAHASGTDVSSSSNFPLVEQYQRAGVLDGVTAYKGTTFTVRTADGAALEEVEGQWVSGNYHAVIGVPFAAGHGFTAEPDRNIGGPLQAVISDSYWARKFGRSPDAIGRTITVGGRPLTIVGVTTPGFNGLRSGGATDLTLPISVRALDEPAFFDDRTGWIALAIVGRLRPGQTEGQAHTAVNAVFRRFWLEPENAWARESSEKAKAAEQAVLLSASRGSSGLRSQYTQPLQVLMAMVAVVLFIACANVANLMLARTSARTKEVAIRLAIGASRGRLVRQFLTESLVLSALGGAVGLLIAAASTRGVLTLLNSGPSLLVLDAGLNARVLAFTLGVSVLTGVGFGLVPALRATRVDLTPTLKSIAPNGKTRRRLRSPIGSTLLVGQIALAVTVITAAGLLGHSLYKLKTLDAGFARDHVVLFEMKAGGTAFTSDQREAFYSELLNRFQAIPGVAVVALADRSPMDFSSQERRIDVPGFPPVHAGVSGVIATPGYFKALGVPLIRGRAFSEDDRAGSPIVAIISEATARKYFGDADPLGHTIVLGGRRDSMSIVGVVGDTRHESLWSEPPRTVYMPLAQSGETFDGRTGVPYRLTATIRTSRDPGRIIAAAPRLVRDVNPDSVVYYPRTLDEQLDAALVTERLLASLSGGFGVLALLLAIVGLYGVLSYGVVRRTRETAIRMALGATRGAVLRLVVRETIAVSVAGISIGLVASLLATKTVKSFLFELSPNDPWTLGIVAAVLTATATLAGLIPARRAARTEPAKTLRAE